MITNNVELKQEPKTISLVEFGSGTVGMISSFTNDFKKGELALSTQSAQPVGHVEKHNNPTPEMIWTFSNIESIYAVIEQLNQIKDSMLAGEMVNLRGVSE